MRIAVVLHMFNDTLIPLFDEYLSNLSKAGVAYDLYLAVPKGSTAPKQWPRATLLERENRGFDIASFFAALSLILPQNYDYILKLHTKSNESWRRELITPILGSPQRVRHALQLFEDPTVGMVGSKKWLLSAGPKWGVNQTHLQRLADEWQVPLTPCTFIGGTIFWIRASILQGVSGTRNLGQLAQTLNTPESVDWAWYLMTYPELRRQGVVDALSAQEHWDRQGKREGKACNCLYARLNRIQHTICDGMVEHAYERFFGVLVAAAGQQVRGVSQTPLLESNQVLTLGWNYLLDGIVYRIEDDLPPVFHPTHPFCFSWSPTLPPHVLHRLLPYLSSPLYLQVHQKPLLVLDQELYLPDFTVLTTTITPDAHFARNLLTAYESALIKTVPVILRGEHLTPTQRQELENTKRYFD